MHYTGVFLVRLFAVYCLNDSQEAVEEGRREREAYAAAVRAQQQALREVQAELVKQTTE